MRSCSLQHWGMLSVPGVEMTLALVSHSGPDTGPPVWDQWYPGHQGQCDGTLRTRSPPLNIVTLSSSILTTTVVIISTI